MFENSAHCDSLKFEEDVDLAIKMYVLPHVLVFLFSPAPLPLLALLLSMISQIFRGAVSSCGSLVAPSSAACLWASMMFHGSSFSRFLVCTSNVCTVFSSEFSGWFSRPLPSWDSNFVGSFHVISTLTWTSSLASTFLQCFA